MPGTVVLRPIQAKLEQKESNATKLDPYCVAIIGEQHAQTDVCKKGGSDPSWNDALAIRMKDEPYCYLEVMDKSLLKDKMLGICAIDLDEVSRQGSLQKWYDLYYEKQPAGRILVEASFSPGEGTAGSIYRSNRPIETQTIYASYSGDLNKGMIQSSFEQSKISQNLYESPSINSKEPESYILQNTDSTRFSLPTKSEVPLFSAERGYQSYQKEPLLSNEKAFGTSSPYQVNSFGNGWEKDITQPSISSFGGSVLQGNSEHDFVKANETSSTVRDIFSGLESRDYSTKEYLPESLPKTSYGEGMKFSGHSDLIYNVADMHRRVDQILQRSREMELERKIKETSIAFKYSPSSLPVIMERVTSEGVHHTPPQPNEVHSSQEKFEGDIQQTPSKISEIKTLIKENVEKGKNIVRSRIDCRKAQGYDDPMSYQEVYLYDDLRPPELMEHESRGLFYTPIRSNTSQVYSPVEGRRLFSLTEKKEDQNRPRKTDIFKQKVMDKVENLAHISAEKLLRLEQKIRQKKGGRQERDLEETEKQEEDTQQQGSFKERMKQKIEYFKDVSREKIASMSIQPKKGLVDEGIQTETIHNEPPSKVEEIKEEIKSKVEHVKDVAKDKWDHLTNKKGKDEEEEEEDEESSPSPEREYHHHKHRSSKETLGDKAKKRAKHVAIKGARKGVEKAEENDEYSELYKKKKGHKEKNRSLSPKESHHKRHHKTHHRKVERSSSEEEDEERSPGIITKAKNAVMDEARHLAVKTMQKKLDNADPKDKNVHHSKRKRKQKVESSESSSGDEEEQSTMDKVKETIEKGKEKIKEVVKHKKDEGTQISEEDERMDVKGGSSESSAAYTIEALKQIIAEGVEKIKEATRGKYTDERPVEMGVNTKEGPYGAEKSEEGGIKHKFMEEMHHVVNFAKQTLSRVGSKESLQHEIEQKNYDKYTRSAEASYGKEELYENTRSLNEDLFNQMKDLQATLDELQEKIGRSSGYTYQTDYSYQVGSYPYSSTVSYQPMVEEPLRFTEQIPPGNYDQVSTIKQEDETQGQSKVQQLFTKAKDTLGHMVHKNEEEPKVKEENEYLSSGPVPGKVESVKGALHSGLEFVKSACHKNTVSPSDDDLPQKREEKYFNEVKEKVIEKMDQLKTRFESEHKEEEETNPQPSVSKVAQIKQKFMENIKQAINLAKEKKEGLTHKEEAEEVKAEPGTIAGLMDKLSEEVEHSKVDLKGPLIHIQMGDDKKENKQIELEKEPAGPVPVETVKNFVKEKVEQVKELGHKKEEERLSPLEEEIGVVRTMSMFLIDFEGNKDAGENFAEPKPQGNNQAIEPLEINDERLDQSEGSETKKETWQETELKDDSEDQPKTPTGGIAGLKDKVMGGVKWLKNLATGKEKGGPAKPMGQDQEDPTGEVLVVSSTLVPESVENPTNLVSSGANLTMPYGEMSFGAKPNAGNVRLNEDLPPLQNTLFESQYVRRSDPMYTRQDFDQGLPKQENVQPFSEQIQINQDLPPLENKLFESQYIRLSDPMYTNQDFDQGLPKQEKVLSEVGQIQTEDAENVDPNVNFNQIYDNVIQNCSSLKSEF